jgi:hypothetical protein
MELYQRNTAPRQPKSEWKEGMKNPDRSFDILKGFVNHRPLHFQLDYDRKHNS